MDLAKKLVETFREIERQAEGEAQCYTVNLSMEDGLEFEITFSTEELCNISDDAMEHYLNSMLSGDCQ